jgi:hypothetical protein
MEKERNRKRQRETGRLINRERKKERQRESGRQR